MVTQRVHVGMGISFCLMRKRNSTKEIQLERTAADDLTDWEIHSIAVQIGKWIFEEIRMREMKLDSKPEPNRT